MTVWPPLLWPAGYFNATWRKTFYLFFFSSVKAQVSFLTQASKNNYTYPRYVWIHYDWYPKNWWKSDVSASSDCSNEELMEFLDNALTIQLPEFGNETTDIGTVSKRFSILHNNWIWLMCCINIHSKGSTGVKPAPCYAISYTFHKWNLRKYNLFLIRE